MSGIIDDKRSIFNQLSVFSSLKEIELKGINNFNSISSINNEKDPLPFLLDLSTSLVGVDGLQDKLGLLFTNFIESYNSQIDDILKDKFVDFNSKNSLPADFITNGITIPISLIDDFNDLKTKKSDPVGELIYDDVNPNLLTKLKDSIISPNSTITHGNVLITYSDNFQTINIKPSGSTTIGNFIGEYIDNINPLNKKEFILNILNDIFGTKTKSQNKTIPELNNENKINILINKLINEEEIEINDEDIEKINTKSEEIYKGFNTIDLGCGYLENVLTFDEINRISDEIINNSDFNSVGNEFINLFNNTLDPDTPEENKNKLKDSFLKRLINNIKDILIKDILFSPEKKLLFILFSYLDNNNINIDDFKDSTNYIKSNKNIVDCFVKDIKSKIVEFIFNLVKTEILEITKPALNKIIIEKINNYKIILRSLVSI